MELRPLNRLTANSIIKQNHYSGTTSFGTKVSLGIYEDGILYGVMQLGMGVHPSGTAKHVSGTANDEYLELNRLWISDDLGYNSESKAIGLMFKWIKKNMPEIKWLITFADGIEGNCGTIYQATNWLYTGYNKSGGLWVTKDGKKMHHLSAMKGLPNSKRETLEAKWGTPLYRVAGGQFRYVYFLNKKSKRHLQIPTFPYPKASRLSEYFQIWKENGVKGDHFEEVITLTQNKKQVPSKPNILF